MTEIQGLGTALITPFDSNGQVDYKALERLLAAQIAGGVDYLVVLGTTGEAATLTAEEKQQICRFIADYISRHPSPVTHHPLPLVLGLGGNNTAAVVEQLQSMSEEQKGAFVAILSVCPYYNKPSQEGLFRHFSAIAEASPLPIILYNVPGRTGVNLLPSTVIRLSQAYPDKIVGIKEASGNLEQIKQLINLFNRQSIVNRKSSNRQFAVISGDDGIAVELMKSGAVGLISVLSNAYPKETADMVHHQDEALQVRFAPLIELLFKEGNPSGVKTVLAQQGLIQNVLRLPLVPNSSEVQEQLSNVQSQISNLP